jgi:hypothetical protein
MTKDSWARGGIFYQGKGFRFRVDEAVARIKASVIGNSRRRRIMDREHEDVRLSMMIIEREECVARSAPFPS